MPTLLHTEGWITELKTKFRPPLGLLLSKFIKVASIVHGRWTRSTHREAFSAELCLGHNWTVQMSWASSRSPLFRDLPVRRTVRSWPSDGSKVWGKEFPWSALASGGGRQTTLEVWNQFISWSKILHLKISSFAITPWSCLSWDVVSLNLDIIKLYQ